MSDSPTSPSGPVSGMARRWTYAILALAFLFVLMPFLFWRSTWFGRPLTNKEIARNLADVEHPRKVQHALSQIADHMLSPNPAVRDAARQWYPQLLNTATHASAEIRLTAAWVMGQDNSFAEFHQSLLHLVRDPHPLVRRNAALSLVRFNDASGLSEISGMLRSDTLHAPEAGVLDQRLQPGDAINPGTLVGHIKVGTEEREVRSEVPGTLERWLVNEGVSVAQSEAIALLSPSPEAVWEALRALVLVGTAEDLTEVERYARGVQGMPAPVRQQAEFTARAIRSRIAVPVPKP